ncbi:MAG TPA: winged helix-turn-helix domain-containing protein [Vicinamibacterales bacterium]
MPRYRFGDFILSPRRRTLFCQGVEQPLIPRYFDLLVFLVERRHEAVHRRDIFDRVWNDVVVSDSALSQAIRTIRRTLGDDSREPRFIRTVSRHGYRFVFAEVVEEEDDGPAGLGRADQPPLKLRRSAEALAAAEARPLQGETRAQPSAEAVATVDVDPFEPLLQTVTRAATTPDEEEGQREAAELLHSLGTSEALRRLGTRPRHAFARALLRDTRWDSARAGAVPIVGEPAPVATGAALIALRLRRAARIAATRWASAFIGGGVAGVVGGIGGGLLLVLAPGSAAPLAAVAVLAVIGGGAGGLGGAGTGAGLSISEAAFRSRRTLALVAGAAVGGALVGGIVEWISRWSLEALVGLQVDVGGAFEGLALGAAAGLGYAATTSGANGGLAAPRGGRRAQVATAMAVTCGLAALLLAISDRPLVGGTIHAIAHASHGSQVELTPFSRLIGEPDFGPLSRALIGTGEGALFGLGLALGLTHRPK